MLAVNIIESNFQGKYGLIIHLLVKVRMGIVTSRANLFYAANIMLIKHGEDVAYSIYTVSNTMRL